MAKRKIWFGGQGPFIYDDTYVYVDDPTLTRRGGRIEGQILVDTAPSVDTEVVRLVDLKSVGYRQGTSDGSGIGSGKFARISAASIFTVGSNDTVQNSLVVGCAESNIAADTACVLKFSGDMQNANWSFPGGNIGAFAYLGSDGLPTAYRPSGGKVIIRLGIIKDTDKLVVNIDYNYVIG